ncbi:MAG: 6-carboxytetrahydropterin synthase QueD [Gemmatimonadetes bacterium]|nr:6-carboxytetrahydropterin synthase QueD [Gemmatimonadota bacterium]NIQ55623.1 6-carboxytetrahydropterin synthase QueD [Gemmatimonadota bacterium]NIU75832.1 6-carboxytetrahydropterin synthase QueD [Gammaproteobacteria bacterium]NIX45468.1 6-carboxytetrahydropterin synthase QueD [Gemmatimonadota bacterium]NIY12783.1 6-carboxytetrahydropterin synthase QueD [Gemmatimonadota bacterium]
MYIVSVQATYDSAHFLRRYKGKCERLHGHHYVVEVALQAEELNEGGLAYDFVDVKKHLRDLADWLDHENINELPPFDEIEPSAENQARFFFDELRQRVPDAMKDAILYTRVWETPTQWAQYSEKTLAF